MKTVLQGLKEMEVTLLANQPELEAFDQIEVLRAKLIDRPGAVEILATLQELCAPQAERTRMELDTVRDAIQILEDQETLSAPELEPDFEEKSLSYQEADRFTVEQPA